MSLLKRNINNKGFTLIELVCSVTIFSILALMEIKLLFNYIKVVDEIVVCGKFYSTAEDTLNFIGDRISEGESHEINNNEILINRNVLINGQIVHKQYFIKMENYNIKITYKTMGNYDSTEVIMEHIDKFQIYKKGNLVYVNISKSGEDLERCFSIVTVKT